MLLLVNRLMEMGFSYHGGYVSVRKVSPFSREPTNPHGCRLPYRLHLSYSPCSCSKWGTLLWHLPAIHFIYMDAEWIQFCCEVTLSFITAPSQQLGGPGKVVQIDKNYFSRRNVIVVGYAPPHFLMVSRGNRGGPFLQRSLIDPPRHRSPSLGLGYYLARHS